MGEDHRLKYTIAGKVFAMPVEITYRQYEVINKLIGAIASKVKEEFKDNPEPATLEVIKMLFDSGKIPDVLAALLIPEEAEVWKPEFSANRELMMDVGDRTVIELLSSFLSGRMALMQGMLASLEGLQKQRPMPTELSGPSPS